MTLTKDDALDILALIVYKRRCKADLADIGSSDGDRNVAEDIFDFFDNYTGPVNFLEESKFEDYECYLPYYEFLKEQITK